ncbi:hypothetical protein K3495_g14808 [Podosphaera aphanis]|nr:hypothetical protein K3495_g14808 [Podosphaera aphanis]
MLMFKDIITGDNILSDSYPIKEVDGFIYECDGSMINKADGANSAETEKVIDIVDAFQLQKTTLDIGSYTAHIRGYLKSVKEKLESSEASAEEMTVFENGARSFVKNVVDNFKDYDFYTSSSKNPDGMVILLKYRDDGTTPYVSVWKHGLTELKV